MPAKFNQLIRCRVSEAMKVNLLTIAGGEEKDYSEVVREAIQERIRRHYAAPRPSELTSVA